VKLRDYAAKEWQGLLSDFYRPRWESFISRLEISLLTGQPFEEMRSYDEELPFVYRKKSYPTAPTGELRQAVLQALEKLHSTAVSHRKGETQEDFETNVLKTQGE
jgi:alpha-N-acetylglucosaminidase